MIAAKGAAMRSRLVCLVGLLAAAATACGSGSSSGRAASPGSDVLGVIQAAADTTAAAQSMRVHGTLAENLEGVTASAGSPPANGGISATFSGDMQTKPLEADLTMSGVSTNGQSISGDIRELITPDGFFMRMPQLAAQTGKPWIEMKFSDMKAMSGLDLKQVISQAQQMQPAQYIEQLAAGGHVRQVGRDTVNGVATTHYSGTVSLADMLSHYSPDVRAQFAPVLHSAGFTG